MLTVVSMMCDVGTLVSFRPRGPLRIHPRMVRIAKGPPFLLSLTSFDCMACGTSLPISRPISASIFGTSIPLRCGQRLTSSLVPIAAVETGRLGREYTIGSSIRFWLPISETSRLTRENSMVSLDFPMVVSKRVALSPLALRFLRSSIQNEVLDPESRNA